MESPKSARFFFLILFFAGAALAAPKPELARQILGLRLGMTEELVHVRLKEIGSLVRKESGEQEVWKVNDASFSHLLVGFAKDDRLRYVTAVAREDKEAKRVPYSSIGDLAKARQAGDPKIKVYNYQWHLPEEKSEPETLVIAIGRDSENLSSYSLKRLGAGAEAVEKD